MPYVRIDALAVVFRDQVLHTHHDRRSQMGPARARHAAAEETNLKPP